MTARQSPSVGPGRALATDRLPTPLAFGLLVSIVVFFLAGSAAPTPLYASYQGEWGFSAVTTTVVFGVYALAVLAALLTVGRLSDHIGRRPVLLAAIALQAVAMLIFVGADGVPELLLGRVVQGLATGAVAGAVGAGLLDLARTRGTLANAVATPIGTATGSLLGGLLVQFLPAPTHLVYLALSVVFVMQGSGRSSWPRPPARAGAIASLRPRVRACRRAPAAVARGRARARRRLVAGRLYGALGPALVRTLSGSIFVLLGGLSLFTLAGSGAAAVLLLARCRRTQ